MPYLVGNAVDVTINQTCFDTLSRRARDSNLRHSDFEPDALTTAYPLKFVHDLGFWLNDSDDTIDVFEMFDIVRCVAGNLVINVELVDTYTEPNTGRHSLCYRLHFITFDLALSYSASWKLQSLIRMEVARRLPVTLR